MITLNIIGFLLVIVFMLGFGAFVAVHIYGCNSDQNSRVDRFRRDVAVNDAADSLEQFDDLGNRTT